MQETINGVEITYGEPKIFNLGHGSFRGRSFELTYLGYACIGVMDECSMLDIIRTNLMWQRTLEFVDQVEMVSAADARKRYEDSSRDK